MKKIKSILRLIIGICVVIYMIYNSEYLDDLKDTLQKYGVRFDNVTVKNNATQSATNQQDYTEQNNNQKHQQEQSRDNEKQKNNSNSFEDMMDSFKNEGIEE